MSPNFDASRYLAMLQAEGLSQQQAESVVHLLGGAIEETLLALEGSVITREEQRAHAESYKEEFKELRKDINLLGKKDFAVLKMELERLVGDVVKLKESMRGEINRVHAGVRLDINLEKGRVKDEVTVLDGKVQHASEHIDREVSGLREQLETIERDIVSMIVRLMGLFVAVFAVYKLTQTASGKAARPGTAAGSAAGESA